MDGMVIAQDMTKDDGTPYKVFTPFWKKTEQRYISKTSTKNFYNEISSLAGCYYITATDSLIYSNESIPSDTICFDNCPSNQSDKARQERKQNTQPLVVTNAHCVSSV